MKIIIHGRGTALSIETGDPAKGHAQTYEVIYKKATNEELGRVYLTADEIADRLTKPVG